MDSLFNLIFKAVSVEPRYQESLCLAAGRTVSCTACADVCPHDAIRIGRGIEIDNVDCSGCGLCIHACPTGALEVKPSFESGRAVKCSQVAGSAQTVHCLGRLQAGDLLRLLGTKDSVTLGRGDCANCPIGEAAIARAVEAARDEAQELAGLHQRSVRIQVVETTRLESNDRGEAVSRRELLRGGWRSLQDKAADALAPFDPGEDDPDLPSEMQRRYRVISASRPEPEAHVPWRLPRVSDSCIMCPLCTNACPTGAIERLFEKNGDGYLQVKPDHCMGCDACMTACPVDAISMDDQVTWEELSGGAKEAFRRDAESRRHGSVARS